MMKWTAFLVAAAGGLAAIAAAEAHDVRTLAGSEWSPLEIDGAPVAAGVEAFVTFGGDGRVAGSGSCNRFSGPYTQDGHDLTFGALAATRMACPPPAGEVEAAFFAALSRVAHVEEPERWHITLFDRDGAIVMRLSQRDRD